MIACGVGRHPPECSECVGWVAPTCRHASQCVACACLSGGVAPPSVVLERHVEENGRQDVAIDITCELASEVHAPWRAKLCALICQDADAAEQNVDIFI
jgi:hypothetical protein